MKQIHGHEVMKMMIESEKSYSKDELKKLDLHAPVKLFFEND